MAASTAPRTVGSAFGVSLRNAAVKGGDVNANGSFKSRQAPCGRLVDGENYEDRDDDCFVTHETVYACGCQSIHHEYHDGCVSRRIVRHDGKLLVDEMLSAE